MLCKVVDKAYRFAYEVVRRYYWSLCLIGVEKGKNLQLYGRVRIFGNGCNIKIGNNCSLNEGVILSANGKIIIGDNVTISSYTVLHTEYLDLECFPRKKHIYKDIVIKDNVWIASHCVIMGGVTINENVVVGANSFVNRDLEADFFYAGTPAKKIRRL